MNVLLSIGHTDLLLPDEKGLQTLLGLLGKSLVVRDHLYKGEIQILRQEPRIEFKTVPSSTRFVTPASDADDAPDVPVTPFINTKPRRIGAAKPQRLLNY
jgi:hypothetical protein